MANDEVITCDFEGCNKPFAYRVKGFNLCSTHCFEPEEWITVLLKRMTKPVSSKQPDDLCKECGHAKSCHVEKFGGICVGCPCSGFKDADYVTDPGPGFEEAVKNAKFEPVSSKCDCHLHEHQVCDVCQGVSSKPEIPPDLRTLYQDAATVCPEFYLAGPEVQQLIERIAKLENDNRSDLSVDAVNLLLKQRSAMESTVAQLRAMLQAEKDSSDEFERLNDKARADAHNLKSPVHSICNQNLTETLAAALEEKQRADKAEKLRDEWCAEYTKARDEAAQLRAEVATLKHDLQQAQLLHESCHETRELVTRERDALKAETERLIVQRDGCTTAALGWISEPATRDQWGWSQAYQDVLELRQKYDAQTAELSRLKQPVSDEECLSFENSYGEKLLLNHVEVGLTAFLEARSQGAKEQG